MDDPLAAYKPFLTAIDHHGVLRMGVHEHIVIARLVAVAQEKKWPRGELGVGGAQNPAAIR